MMRGCAYLLLFCGSLFASDIDELISKIMTPSSIEQSRVSAAKDPFEKEVFKDGNATVPVEPTFVLKAIMLNEALINNKWYKVGDKMEDYTLEWVEKNRVGITTAGKKQKTLYIFKGLK